MMERNNNDAVVMIIIAAVFSVLILFFNHQVSTATGAYELLGMQVAYYISLAATLFFNLAGFFFMARDKYRALKSDGKEPISSLR